MRLVVLAAAVMLVLGPGLESAGATLTAAPTYAVTFENRSGETVYLAVIKKWGSPCGSDTWHLTGWWTLVPGDSHTVNSLSRRVYFYAEAEDGGHWDGNDDPASQISMYVHSSRLNYCEYGSGSWSDADSGATRVIGEGDYEVNMGRIDVTGSSYTMNLNP